MINKHGKLLLGMARGGPAGGLTERSNYTDFVLSGCKEIASGRCPPWLLRPDVALGWRAPSYSDPCGASVRFPETSLEVSCDLH